MRAALASFERQIELALVYGSVAKGKDHAGSDVDLLVVSDGVSVAELLPRLLASEAQLGRKLSPTVYGTGDFAQRRSDLESFVGKVLNQRTLLLLDRNDEPASAR